MIPLEVPTFGSTSTTLSVSVQFGNYAKETKEIKMIINPKAKCPRVNANIAGLICQLSPWENCEGLQILAKVLFGKPPSWKKRLETALGMFNWMMRHSMHSTAFHRTSLDLLCITSSELLPLHYLPCITSLALPPLH